MTMDEIIERYICSPSSVAIVGASAKSERPVYEVMEYLAEKGFKLFPVNPRLAGDSIQGIPCIASLSELEQPVDIVALFVSPEKQQVILDEIKTLADKPVIWMQPGAENDAGERDMKNRGYDVVKGGCLMMVHQVYCGGE